MTKKSLDRERFKLKLLLQEPIEGTGSGGGGGGKSRGGAKGVGKGVGGSKVGKRERSFVVVAR
jgi:hypothetical protein